jgi:hypothetical protein
MYPSAAQGPALHLHHAKSLMLYHRALKEKYDRLEWTPRALAGWV